MNNRKLLLGFDPKDKNDHERHMNIAQDCMDYFDGVKIQMACYQSPLMMHALHGAIEFFQDNGKYVLIDGKWADVPHTMEKYLEMFYGADGVTISPLFGVESIKPFEDHPGDVFVVWDPSVDGTMLDEVVEEVHDYVGDKFNLVVGANKLEWYDVENIEAIILSPGVGAQGASIPETDNCYIPISRGIFGAEDPIAKCKEYYQLIHKKF